MSKVITFSRQFPSYHPRKGEPTYFIEKVVKSLHWDRPHPPFDLRADFDSDIYINCQPKHHTIRAGHRFKAGDWFSPRVWSGKPYNSKQIQFAPDIQVKKVWDFEIKDAGILIDNVRHTDPLFANDVARHDGLELRDFFDWFQYPKPFQGQIICWNESIEY